MEPDILWTSEQHNELQHEIDVVFKAHPGLDDHRVRHPWGLGYLGDPLAKVWFVAENPSARQARRARGKTPNEQWNTSRGDKLFRELLVTHGLKIGTADEPGGWRCYITNVIKSEALAGEWRSLPVAERREVARWWAPVLKRELQQGRAEIVVLLGDAAEDLLKHLLCHNLVPAPRRLTKVWHYSHVAMRPHGKRSPGDPDTIREWSAQLAKALEALRGQEDGL
ncbi:MAG TPA: uracil-DNA glycosylase family protein [Chloroflexota bacterium]|nr:uracil-DNA glycosylase family protein [Chloroflexota bacterium]